MLSACDRISEEAHGDISSFLSDPFFSDDLGFDVINDDPLANIPVSGNCFFDSSEPLMSSVEPHEFINTYLGSLTSSQSSSFEGDNKRALINITPKKSFGTKTKVQTQHSPILLSQSVGVGAPQKITNANQKIIIVNPLEESFRPRYKSDYFAQNGNSRKPRYVADRLKNHFITLQVPVGVPGRILVHWLTIPDEFGERYIMPYRFQQSNVSLEVQDRNPLPVDIEADKNGYMKLYLVLIKSKQDELKNAQPLQIFKPMRDAFHMPVEKPSTTLNPKQLIRQYHLDQSQLAFTFCGLSADGKTFVPEWDTTVLSTVLQELPPDSTKSKTVSCPKCQHDFEVSINNEQEYVQETNTTKRKVNQTITGKKIKKEASIENGYPEFLY